MTVSSRRTRQLLVLLAVVVLILLIGLRVELSGPFDRCVAYFRAAGPVPFFIAMAVLPIFGFPIALFTVTAGTVFAPTIGAWNVVACAMLAEVVNMTVCYWLAVRPMHTWVDRLMKRLGYTLPELSGGSGWEIVLLVRIVPGIPFFVQNYLLGLARVPFAGYLFISTLVHTALVIGAVFAGDAFARRDPRALVVGLFFLGFAAVAIYRLRRRWAKQHTATMPERV